MPHMSEVGEPNIVINVDIYIFLNIIYVWQVDKALTVNIQMAIL
jgi:hypothetical protein